MKVTPYILLFVLLALLTPNAMAQLDSSSTDALLSFDLDQLVTTPSKVKFSQNESPGIVSVITEKEIKAIGANDLIDVLKLVPGISFHADVNGIVGIGMRGIWGHEGKVLMLIDGQEMNELLYGNLAFGGHYDVTQIKRIEVVRGPGSSVYGGFAELGVINIITKSAEDIHGVEANSSVGFFNDSYAHRNVSVRAGKVYENGSISILGFAGQSHKSNQMYTDIYGKSTNLKNNAFTDPLNLNIGLNYKKLNAKLILDAYNTGSRITYDTVENQTIPARFKSLNAEVNYKFKVGTKLSITPKIQYLHQLPWNNPLPYTSGNLNILTKKILGNVEFDYNYSRQLNVLAGIESFEQFAQNREVTKPNLFTTVNADFIRNFTGAAYVQGTLKNNIANFTLGGRYLYNNLFGTAFSPRVAVTKAFEDVHFKLLYSEAFKAPTLMNMGLNKDIKPEKTQVLEFESGYKISSIFDVSVNVFSIILKDPIVYLPIDGNDYFENFNQTGSMGVEGALRIKNHRWNVNLNYAYYNSAGLNKVDNYAISQNTNSVLGFANHTANVNAIFNATSNFSISNTLSFVGERYGYQFGSVYNEVDSTYAPAKLNPTLQWNIFINKKDLWKGLDVGIGLSNILNQKIYFVQPYDGLNAIYPAFNPMLTIKLAYRFVDFK